MKKLIGGAALVKLGSSRMTRDTDYLVNDESSNEPFMHDVANNIDYINANGHPFFKEVYEVEKRRFDEIASPQMLLELKCFAFVQHCKNYKWQKADDAEYDIKFLCRTFNLNGVEIVRKHISQGELSEVMKVIESVRK
jgi:hypothetical protein